MSVEFDRESPEKFESRTLSRKTLWTGRNSTSDRTSDRTLKAPDSLRNVHVIYIYIYIYIYYTYVYIVLLVALLLSLSLLAYFYGNLREQTGQKRFSTNTYRKLVLLLQKSPKISRNLREFTGECNLGILYSSSLLHPVSVRRFPSFRTQPLENLSHYL